MVWEEYANKWPPEIEKAQKGLNSRMSRGLFVFLLLEGRKTFTELSKTLDIESNKLSYHLKSLVNSGLLTHTYAYHENRKEHSFYIVSNFGNIYAKKCLEAAHHPYQRQIHERVEIPSIPLEDTLWIRKADSAVTTKETPTISYYNMSPEKLRTETPIGTQQFTTDEETTIVSQSLINTTSSKE